MDSEQLTPLTGPDMSAVVRGFVSGQKVLKRYTLKKLLGRGGMGVVWMAFDEELEREVAFKFLPEVVSHDRASLDSLKRETKRSLELTHPNVVRIYDFVQDEFCAGITMEFIDGDTLSNIRTEKPNKVFEAEELQDWVLQLCSALEYAHTHVRVAHRDLKPSNLMITRRGHLKIADFGISRSISDTLTRVTAVVHGASGTLVYMSPQQAMGEAAAASDDIYSVGATLYELMTSKPPFFTGEILTQVREKTPPSMEKRRKDLGIQGKPIPKAWEDTIAACLAKDPAARPKSAREIVERLFTPEVLRSSASSLLDSKGTSQFKKALQDGKATPAAVGEPAASGTPPGQVPPGTTQVETPAPDGAARHEGDGEPRISPPRRPALVLAMAALIVLGVLALVINEGKHATARVGALEISTVPAGASVKINGVEVGHTPWIQNNAKLGLNTIELEKEGYFPLVMRTNVAAGDPTRVELALDEVRGEGSVTFATVPPDVKVVINGQAVTERPVKFKAGRFVLKASHEGYEPRTVNVEVHPNRETDLGVIQLDHVMGSLRVSAAPAEAEVEVKTDSGFKRGHVNEVLADVPVGEYLVKVSLDGYEPRFVPAVVSPKATVQVGPVTLARSKGSVVFTTEPAEATVQLKSADFGPREFAAGTTITNLPAGSYQATVRMNGYLATNFTVKVQANQLARLEPVHLSQVFGSISLSADHPGAVYTLTGPRTFHGQLPTRLEKLPAGTYKLEVAADQYDTVNREVEVLAERDVPVSVDLDRSKGTLDLKSSPVAASFQITGNEITPRTGVAPASFADLPTGFYQIIGTYKRWSVTNTIVVERNQTVASTLKFPFGSVRIDSVPAKAVVYQGNKRLGETPLTLNEVSLGRVEYRLECVGYRFATVSGEVRPQEVTQIKPMLEVYPGPQKGMKEWVNSLGMKFVPVGDLWICEWETRVKDFEAFYEQSYYNAGSGWRNPGFAQSSTHPVVNVSWNDAVAFCKWLTEQEQKTGVISGQTYRLPTDLEWSMAAGLRGETGLTPAQRDGATPGVYGWGKEWPPPPGTANLANVISYDDYEFTSPVGTFKPNAYGLFDMEGNAWEWCQDTYDNLSNARVLRGESWNLWPNSTLSLSNRRFLPPDTRVGDAGFRCVIQVSPGN